TTHIPFAVGALALPGTQSVDYRGILAVTSAGEYRFALDTGIAAQLFVDDQLVVDTGGVHAPRRSEGSVVLADGDHVVSLQYMAIDRAEWALFLEPPGGQWAQADGSEFVPPTGAFTPPALVTLDPDPTWGINGRKVEGLEAPDAVTVLPDGTTVVGAANKLAFVHTDGSSRTVDLTGVEDIVDLDVTPEGLIAVLDHTTRSMLLVDGD